MSRYLLGHDGALYSLFGGAPGHDLSLRTVEAWVSADDQRHEAYGWDRQTEDQVQSRQSGIEDVAPLT
jgi:hypothetical protein